MSKPEINIVWFKRDLRFTDHEPLFVAQQQSLPVLLLYIFEPSVMAYDDSDTRHWRFVYESLQEMNERLKNIHAQLYIFHQEALTVFQYLSNFYQINTIFSHQEIGNKLTFDRDKSVAHFFKLQKIIWKEYQLHGVIRRLKSRNDWDKKWQQTMSSPAKLVDETNWNIVSLNSEVYDSIKGEKLPEELKIRNNNFQQGGESFAWRYMNSFIKERYVNYSKHISKPLLSRKGCSRLSSYLTYGNISMRMVYKYTRQHYEQAENKRALTNFISRLHWHCHFMQKFEDECSMDLKM